MAWFAASVIVCFRFREGPQDTFPVWENVLLVEAENDEQANARALELAHEEVADDDPSLTWGGRPARIDFVGIRKILTVQHAGVEGKLGHGDEVTYSEFELGSEAALKALAAGEDVVLKYVEG